MIFRQLFEPVSSTYTYLVACSETREAVLIDPVLEAVDRDLALLKELGLTLKYTIETHIHADHVTSAARLRDETGSRAAVPEKSGAAHVDLPVREGEPIRVGNLELEPLYTPGHTDDHHAYLLRGDGGYRIFTAAAPISRMATRRRFTDRCTARSSRCQAIRWSIPATIISSASSAA